MFGGKGIKEVGKDGRKSNVGKVNKEEIIENFNCFIIFFLKNKFGTFQITNKILGSLNKEIGSNVQSNKCSKKKISNNER
jgi:hypothetical protein